MNARLKPITARCFEPPAYDNRHVRYAGSWVNANIDALRDYYREQGGELPGEGDDYLTAFARAQAFSAWCNCQRDIEIARNTQ